MSDELKTEVSLTIESAATLFRDRDSLDKIVTYFVENEDVIVCPDGTRQRWYVEDNKTGIDHGYHDRIEDALAAALDIIKGRKDGA